MLEKLENLTEKTMYASRWLLAPIYIGMSLGLIALFFKFFEELFHLLPHLFDVTEETLVLKLLTLIDLSLVGSLIVIVMFSGYENFVSRLNLSDSTEKLNWLGTHDYGSLKVKLASSIVAITSIHLLKVFMNVEKTDSDKIMWYVIVHMSLVISAVMLGYLDKLSKH